MKKEKTRSYVKDSVALDKKLKYEEILLRQYEILNPGKVREIVAKVNPNKKESNVKVLESNLKRESPKVEKKTGKISQELKIIKPVVETKPS